MKKFIWLVFFHLTKSLHLVFPNRSSHGLWLAVSSRKANGSYMKLLRGCSASCGLHFDCEVPL